MLFVRQGQKNTGGFDQAAETRNETKKDEKAACGSEGLAVRRIMNPVQPGEYHKFQVNLDS